MHVFGVEDLQSANLQSSRHRFWVVRFTHPDDTNVNVDVVRTYSLGAYSAPATDFRFPDSHIPRTLILMYLRLAPATDFGSRKPCIPRTTTSICLELGIYSRQTYHAPATDFGFRDSFIQRTILLMHLGLKTYSLRARTTPAPGF